MTFNELWYLEALTSDEVQRAIDSCILNKCNFPNNEEEKEKLKIITKIGSLALARDFQIKLDKPEQLFISTCTDHLENYVDEALHYSAPEFIKSHIFPTLDDLYYRSAKNGGGIKGYDEHKTGYLKSLHAVTENAHTYAKLHKK